MNAQTSPIKLPYSFKNHTCRFSNLSYSNCEHIKEYLTSYLNSIDKDIAQKKLKNSTLPKLCYNYNIVFDHYQQIKNKGANPHTFVNLLEKNFPFLKVLNEFIKKRWAYKHKIKKDNLAAIATYNALFSENQVEIYQCILIHFIKNLDSIRNFHTHIEHDPIKLEPISLLNIEFLKDLTLPFKEIMLCIYDSAVNATKNRFNASEEEVMHLRRYSGKKKPNKNFHYPLFTSSDLLTFEERGYAFFINLFAQADDAVLYLKQIRGFKKAETRNERLTVEAFSHFSIKPGVEKLDWKQNEQSMILDALNELRKLPKELKQVLNQESLQQFLDDFYEKTDETEEAESGNYIRYQSRFEYFAINLLSLLLPHNPIRFYTYLGKYYEKGYLKQLPDGTSKMRYIMHPVYGFFKNWFTCPSLKEFSRMMQSESSDLEVLLMPQKSEPFEERSFESEATFKPHILFAYPHCVINDQKIGIRFFTEDQKNEAQTDTNIYPHIHSTFQIENPKVDYWLSRYELKNLLFYVLLQLKKSNTEIDFKAYFEKHISADYIKKQRTFKPENYIQSQINYSQVNNHAIQESLRNSKSYGKRNRAQLKFGQIASELTKDIVFLRNKPEGYQDTLTGPIYQTIHKHLAIWNWDTFKRILESTNITRHHPFLRKEVLNRKYTSIYDFANNYWQARKEFFEKQLQLFKQANNKLLDPTIQKRMETKKDSITLVAKDLPRGLFKEAIHTLLSPSLKVEGKNETSLIYEYFQSKKMQSATTTNALYDSIQPFYKTKRNYSFFETFNCNQPLSLEERLKLLDQHQQKIINFKQAWKRDSCSEIERKRHNHFKFLSENEKKIRMHIAEDILLFEAIKETNLFKIKELLSNKQLSDIKDITNTKFPSFSFDINGCKIEFKDISPKKYGRLLAFQQNKRIKALTEGLKQFNTTITNRSIPMEVLQNELDAYDKTVNFVIAIVQEFETLVDPQSNQSYKKEEKGGYYEFETLIKGLPNAKQLNKIRNRFLHGGILFWDNNNPSCPFKAYLQTFYSNASDLENKPDSIYHLAQKQLLEYIGNKEVSKKRHIPAITKEYIIQQLLEQKQTTNKKVFCNR